MEVQAREVVGGGLRVEVGVSVAWDGGDYFEVVWAQAQAKAHPQRQEDENKNGGASNPTAR